MVERKLLRMDEVAERLIQMFSVRGETVLDPFLGSGTTVKAAMQTGRCSVGYEVDKRLLNTIKAKVNPYCGKQSAVTVSER